MCYSDVWALQALSVLGERTSVPSQQIPLNDRSVYQLFHCEPEQDAPLEFLTERAKAVLRVVHPEDFDALKRVYGLSRSPCVWYGYAEEKLKELGVGAIGEVISCTEDVSDLLVANSVDVSTAKSFAQYISNRRTCGLDVWEDWHWDSMLRADLPDIDIECLSKITFLVSRAECVRAARLAYQLAWYKRYFLEEYAETLRGCIA